jgi:acetylornithine deacetylase/succinyl-diaminopimelate desuccinylase-like protein
MPGIADNALVKAARLIERLAAYRPEPQLQPEVEGFLRAVLGDVPSPGSVLERARAVDPTAAEVVEPLLAPTFSPTIISASQKRNVIPAVCEVVVDCRLLPGQHPDAVEPIVRAVIGSDVAYDLEWLEAHGGTRSPLDTPLWQAVEEFVAATEPDARAVPICVAGFTDSHWLREAFGTIAYGFFPLRAMPAEVAAQLIHSADERVPVDDVELGVDWLRHAARSICS